MSWRHLWLFLFVFLSSQEQNGYRVVAKVDEEDSETEGDMNLATWNQVTIKQDVDPRTSSWNVVEQDEEGNNNIYDEQDEDDSFQRRASCSSHKSCTNCSSASRLCHWCDSDNACHEVGSVHGCLVGSTCKSSDNGRNGTNTTDACALYSNCTECYNTHTCHWCAKDQACHTKGSFYGCAWGVTCNRNHHNTTKNNTSCASYTTCSDCALSSHFCHWCEHDNACHAVGSRYGCATGVDCYSNDRCRRKEPERFKKFVFTRMPVSVMIVVLVVGLLLVASISCCYYMAGGIKGAYEDLATMTMAASVPPSIIGQSLAGQSLMGPPEMYYTALDTHPEEETPETTTGAEDSAVDEEEAHETAPQQDVSAAAAAADASETTEPQSTEMMGNRGTLSEPLLPPLGPSSYEFPEMHRPVHMNRLYHACTACYIFSLVIIAGFIMTSIYFFPQRPVYNVCNDAVAWKKIIGNIASLKLDASFEILISVSNPNHIQFALDQGKGDFMFEDNHVGTFEIPPATVAAMSVTDLMIIARVTPDKLQALQLVEAYYLNKLILDADFKAKIRVPALNDFVYHLEVQDIVVNVTELSDRSLCACPSWDDGKNHSIALPFL